jgi:hypothetical protein
MANRIAVYLKPLRPRFLHMISPPSLPTHGKETGCPSLGAPLFFAPGVGEHERRLSKYFSTTYELFSSLLHLIDQAYE